MKQTFAFVLACMLCALSIAKAETALEMSSICQRAANAQVGSNGRVTFPNDTESSICWGAFLALQELAAVAWEGEKANVLGFCAPPESTRLQFIRVFQKHVADNPSRAHEAFGKTAVHALKNAFPCAK